MVCPGIKLDCCGCVCGWGISVNLTFFQWEWCCWTHIYAVLGVYFGNSLIFSFLCYFPSEFTKGLSQRISLWGPECPILVGFACSCGACVEEEQKSYGRGWPTPPLRWGKGLCPAHFRAAQGLLLPWTWGLCSSTTDTQHFTLASGRARCRAQREQTGTQMGQVQHLWGRCMGLSPPGPKSALGSAVLHWL